MDKLLPDYADAAARNVSYDFTYPQQESDLSPEIQMIKALSGSRAFRRLNEVRFLGALDYCLIAHPNGMNSNSRFTRAQHSLGVAALARSYLSLTNHSNHDRLLCVATAMLHDIGHPPFSHTLEPIFKEKFGFDHHSMSNMIISGHSVFGDEILKILSEFNIDSNDIVNILDGNDDTFDQFFSGPINFDTIEGILRSRRYLRMQNLGITPLSVVRAATKRSDELSKEIVDNFWNCKDEMYNLVIRSKTGVFFDTLFQEIARDISDDLIPADFLMTESQAFKKYPELRDATKKELWSEMASALLPETIPFSVRHFYIDQTASFYDRDDARRYRQSKKQSILTRQDIVPA